MPQPGGNSSHIRNSVTADGDLGSLPEGWEERVHTDGRIFFIDHSMYENNF